MAKTAVKTFANNVSSKIKCRMGLVKRQPGKTNDQETFVRACSMGIQTTRQLIQKGQPKQ
ncbi:hypothetical protein [Planococcus sp. YIM B11945]|uniref:hypothetical protein n=1 Tax=Planococcus sp. YIM B11945 TaxID=3435410 RepID=UPI003D7CFCB7